MQVSKRLRAEGLERLAVVLVFLNFEALHLVQRQVQHQNIAQQRYLVELALSYQELLLDRPPPLAPGSHRHSAHHFLQFADLPPHFLLIPQMLVQLPHCFQKSIEIQQLLAQKTPDLFEWVFLRLEIEVEQLLAAPHQHLVHQSLRIAVL